jgi:hypothetical protein
MVRSGGGDAASGRGGAASGGDGAASGGGGVKSDQDGAASEQDGAASEQDGAASEQYGAASEQDGAASEQYGAASDKDGAAGDQDGTASDQDGAAGDQDGAASDRGGAASHCAPLSYPFADTHPPAHSHSYSATSFTHTLTPMRAFTHAASHTRSYSHTCPHTQSHVHLLYPPLDNDIRRVCQGLLLTRLTCALTLGILPIHSLCPQLVVGTTGLLLLPSFGIPTHVWYARGGAFSVKVLWRNCCNPVPNTRMPTYSLFAPRTI